MKSILIVFSLGVALTAAGSCMATPESAPEASTQAARHDFKLVTPDVLTPSGKQFIHQCDDKAFAATDDERGLANRCERLLTGWRQEAHALVASQPPGPPSVGVPYGRPMASSSAYRYRQ